MAMDYFQVKDHHCGSYTCRISVGEGEGGDGSGWCVEETTAQLTVEKKRLPPVFLRRLAPIWIEQGQRLLAEVRS